MKRLAVKTNAEKSRGNADQYFSNFLILSNAVVDRKAGGVGGNTSAMGQLGVPNPRLTAVANSELVPGFALHNTPSAHAQHEWLQDQTTRTDAHPRLTAERARTFTPHALPDVLPLFDNSSFPAYSPKRSLLVAKTMGR